MKRRNASWALLLVAGLALSACAGSSKSPAGPAAAGSGSAPASASAPPGDPANLRGSITFRSWSPIDQTTKQMIEVFTAKYPGTSVDATVFNYPEYLVDLQTRARSDTMPDVIGLQPGALTQQYREKLLPLNDCAAKTWGPDWQQKFYPIGIQQARAGNPQADENFYMLPLLTQTVNLWANSEIFAAEGLRPPKTWEELVAVTKKLSGKAYAPFLLPAKDGWLRNVVFLQIVNNISPGTVYQAESGDIKWTDPAIVKGFEYFGKLFTDGIAQQGAIGLDAYPSGANQFEAGNAAMIPLGAWWIQQSDPTKTGLPPLSEGMKGYQPFLFPTIPGGADQAQYVGGIDVGLGIAKNTKNPDLACALLTDWIAGAGAQKLINTFNDIPAVTGLNPETFTSQKQRAMWQTFTTEWLPKVDYSRYFNDPKIDQAVADALAGVATGQLTPQAAAQSVQRVHEGLGK